MTENFYIPRSHSNHSTFGGMIYDGDFDGYTSMVTIAERILSDEKFDKYCETCARIRERSQKINKQYHRLQNGGH